MPRLFSVEEANALLPTIEQHLARVGELRLAAREVNEELADLEIKARSNGRDHSDDLRLLRARLDELRQGASAAIEAITALGCDVKSLDEGLVDFPARRGGRVVYLCWKRGEDRIRYWHELDAGFAGRQPLDDEFGT